MSKYDKFFNQLGATLSEAVAKSVQPGGQHIAGTDHSQDGPLTLQQIAKSLGDLNERVDTLYGALNPDPEKPGAVIGAIRSLQADGQATMEAVDKALDRLVGVERGGARPKGLVGDGQTALPAQAGSVAVSKGVDDPMWDGMLRHMRAGGTVHLV